MKVKKNRMKQNKIKNNLLKNTFQKYIIHYIQILELWADFTHHIYITMELIKFTEVGRTEALYKQCNSNSSTKK